MLGLDWKWASDLKRILTRVKALDWLGAGLCSGALFALFFAYHVPVPAKEYMYRDDAVITLSHARNLIDYGSIGVDASGARVEGFSAPLQFWAYAVIYGLTHCRYEDFFDLQAPVCTFLLGFALVQLFRPRYVLGLMLSAGVAFWLTNMVRFYGWHHSGMENPYAHALFVATLACFTLSLDTGAVGPLLILSALAASLVRTESILHIAPILAIFAVAYWREHRSLKGANAAAIVLLGWALYQGYRIAYFGDWRPNTAVAEGIDVVARVKALFQTNSQHLADTLAAIKQIAGEHRVYAALLAIPLVAMGEVNNRNRALVLMLASLCATGLVHPVLFGSARLDPARTTSHVALVAPLLVTTQWTHLPRLSVRLISLLLVCFCLTLYLLVEPKSDTYFCCAIGRADAIADTCLAFAKKERLIRPSLANPDLGKISFRKRFRIFDLGMLGSPPLANLRRETTAIADYLFDLAAPDFIEMHGGWTCVYDYLQHDPRFRERYVPVFAADKIGLSDICGTYARAGIWFRRDMARSSTTDERKLLDDLDKRLDTGRIAAELRRCKRQSGSLACIYVARTVYRFIPELVSSGRLPQVISLFRTSPSAAYDMSILGARYRGTWYRQVVDFTHTYRP